jgi:hypothetical protein
MKVQKSEQAGRLRMSCTSDVIQKISDPIMQKKHVTVEQLQAEAGLFQATVHSIIRDDLKMRKRCSQWIPHDLTQQQMPIQQNFLLVW